MSFNTDTRNPTPVTRATSEHIKNFYDLDAWQQGHLLALEIYKITGDFPREELFGLVSQLRRASSSITANLAEGFERYHFKDKIRFYYQSRGSAAEVQNFILLARDLRLIDQATFKALEQKISRVRKLINGLIRSTEAHQ